MASSREHDKPAHPPAIPPAIPVDRPVIGEDLIALRKRLGHSLGDALYLYGMYSGKYAELTSPRKNGRQAVNRGTIAIMTRLLDAAPEFDPLPKPVPFHEFIEHLQRLDHTLTVKKIGIMLGGDAGSGYRWLKGTKMYPVVEHLVIIIDQAVKQYGKAGLDLFADIVEAERLAQGKTEGNFYSAGSWRDKATGERSDDD